MDWEQQASERLDHGDINYETQRLVSLHTLGLLDSEANPALDGIVKAAAGLFGASMALVTLIDGDRQWFKAKFDPQCHLSSTTETPRSIAFCDRTIRSEEVMMVANAEADPLFKDNPLVTEDPKLRFYLGAPLQTPAGAMLGALCVLDKEEKHAAVEQQEALSRLATVVVDLLVAEAETNSQLELIGDEDPTDAEQKILHHARSLLAEYGASEFSVRKVARESSISLGHLQHYFKDKRTLLLAVLDSVAEQLNTYFSDNLGAIKNPNDRIMRLATVMLDRGGESHVLHLLREFWVMSPRDESIAQSLKTMHERTVQFLASAIREANGELSQEGAEAQAAVSLSMLSGAYLFQGQSSERDAEIRQSILESMIVLPSSVVQPA